MERGTTLKIAKDLMGINFVGPDELNVIADKMGIINPYLIETPIPSIPFEKKLLEKVANDYILILGLPYTKKKELLTIEKMHFYFGVDPVLKEPCFYNQDWYLKDNFVTKETLEFNWYLVKKEVFENSRGKKPDEFLKQYEKIKLPSAILCTFSFFAWYFHTKGEILWNHDYIWCKDKDCNGDQVYVGRYSDPQGVNKSGFSIHRHLSIKYCYGVISEL